MTPLAVPLLFVDRSGLQRSFHTLGQPVSPVLHGLDRLTISPVQFVHSSVLIRIAIYPGSEDQGIGVVDQSLPCALYHSLVARGGAAWGYIPMSALSFK